MFTCDIYITCGVMFTCEASIIKVVIFQFSSNMQKQVVRHFSSQKWKEVVSVHVGLQEGCCRCRPQRGCGPAVTCLQRAGRGECPALVCKSAKGENGEKEYSKTEIHMLFLQNCWMIFTEAFKKSTH